MKKMPRQMFGFLGLVLVIAMTFFAAITPSPEVAAVSSTVTDSITVTVTAPTYIADVNFLDHKKDLPYVEPNQNISFNFSSVELVEIVLEYTDINNTSSQYVVYNKNVGLQSGSDVLSLDLSNYGYGKYKVTILGDGQYGPDTDQIVFSYIPVTATIEYNNNTNEVYSILDYDVNNRDIDHLTINIYNEEGNLIDALSPIIVQKPNKRIELPFASNNIPSGKYTVLVSAINAAGNIVYAPYSVVFNYRSANEPVSIPDTGGLFMRLDVSKLDYLITGLILFAMVGIGGIAFIIKRGSKRN